MNALLRLFAQLMLLRISPQAIPYSQWLLALLLLAHLLVGMALASFTLTFEEALLSAVLGSLLMATLSWLLLTFYGVAQRAVQVVTALAGCEVAIGLLSVPVNAWFYAVAKADAGIPALLSILLLGWNVALAAHIYRHGVGVSKSLGFLFATIYMVVSIMVVSQIGAPEG